MDFLNVFNALNLRDFFKIGPRNVGVEGSTPGTPHPPPPSGFKEKSHVY